MVLELIKSTNLALRFVLEICVLAALGYWGFKVERALLLKIGLGIGTPLLAAVVWATFGSPQASIPVSDAVRVALELVLFGAAASALYATRHPVLASVFGIAAVANWVLMYIWGQ